VQAKQRSLQTQSIIVLNYDGVGYPCIYGLWDNPKMDPVHLSITLQLPFYSIDKSNPKTYLNSCQAQEVNVEPFITSYIGPACDVVYSNHGGVLSFVQENPNTLIIEFHSCEFTSLSKILCQFKE
jgi:hypothetical protein